MPICLPPSPHFQDVHILTPGTCECAVLPGKGELRLEMELRLIIRWLRCRGYPRWPGRLPWWLGKESACNAGDSGLIPGSGRSPGEGNGNPVQYSCLKISMDREKISMSISMDRFPWQATVHLQRARCDWETHTHNVITRVLKGRRGRQWCKRKCQNDAVWDGLHQSLLAFKDGERGP